MAKPQASDILGHVTLVTGPEEFLNQRTVTAAITAVRLFDRYAGEQGLSLAVEVTLQPGDKSFAEADIAAISAKIGPNSKGLTSTRREDPSEKNSARSRRADPGRARAVSSTC